MREQWHEDDEPKPQAMPSWSWSGLAVLALAGIGTGWLITEMISLIVKALMMAEVPE